MAGIDKSTRRVIAVIALLVVAAWALRGYIPGGERPAERERPPENPASMAAVVALVTVAVAIVGFAIITRMRDKRPPRPPAGELPRSPAAGSRPTWRFSLAALAFLIGWLLLVILLTRIGGPGAPEPPASAPPTAPETSAPASASQAQPPSPAAEPEADTSVIEYLIPPMVVFMVLVVMGTAIAARRQRRAPQPYLDVGDIDDAPEPAAQAESLARAAEVGLAEIGDLTREPREAIIACYAAMEGELMRVPGAMPQDFDTPTEVLARAVDRHALRADSATELVELFEEARFSPHVMTEAHRDAAVRVLERVLAEIPRATTGVA